MWDPRVGTWTWVFSLSLWGLGLYILLWVVQTVAVNLAEIIPSRLSGENIPQILFVSMTLSPRNVTKNYRKLRHKNGLWLDK